MMIRIAVVVAAGLLAQAAACAATAPQTHITLNGRTAAVQGSGAAVSGSTITISKAGSYAISGRLDDGQLIVDTADKADVRLVLQNATLHSSTTSPLEVRTAERVVLELPAGSASTLSDGGQSKAALRSDDDLSIEGTGTLTVRGNVADGIQGNDGLKIDGGTLIVTSAGDALSINDQLTVNAGALTLTAGGGSAKQVKGSRGMNVGKMIAIRGGSVTIDAADDALNADDAIAISGGTLSLATSNDGIHSENSIVISGGTVRIARSYEGIESAMIVISGGRTQLASSDDGINIVGKAGPAAGFGFRGGTSSGELVISGGYVVVDAGGDGIDSDGSVDLSAGTVIVNGPVMRGNGALDYDGDFRLSGGFLVAVGSAGMAQAPGTSSTQNSARVYFNSMLPAGTAVHIATAGGAPLLSFVPTKAFQSLVFSSPALKTGESYVVYTGGQLTGKGTDGVYAGASHAGGTEQARFTVSSVVSGAGTGGRERGGFRRRGTI